MTKTKINVGLLGLGRLGTIYARYLAGAVPETRLVAVADSIPDRAKEAAEQWDVPRWHAQPLDLLDDDQVEAVVITSPTNTHRELIEAAAARGKAIFCEKPLSLSLEDSQAIKAVLDRTGVFFHLGFQRRFDRGYVAAKRKIDDGVIGAPIVFKATSRDPYLPSLEYLDPRNSGGLFVDMGIHDFDLGLWLIGKVRTVHAIGGVLAFPEVEKMADIDNAVVSLTFQSGALGVVDLSRSGLYGYDIATEILGTQGTIRVGYLRETPLLVLTKNNVSHDVVPYFPERFGDAYTAQLQNFAKTVLAGRPPQITVEDGIAALRLSLAAAQSQRSGQTVEVRS